MGKPDSRKIRIESSLERPKNGTKTLSSEWKAVSTPILQMQKLRLRGMKQAQSLPTELSS